MESQYIGGKSNTDGGGMPEKEVRVANQRRVGSCESLVRVLAVLLTLVAAIVQGLNKQTKVVPIKVVPTLPAIYIPLTAKWHDLSAFAYLLVANVIACVYAAFSLVLSFANRGTKKSSLGLFIIVLDILIVGVLFSAIGAAMAIGLIGYHGNSHVQWNKVCNVFDRFCHQVIASVVLTQFAALAFIFLVVLAILRLNRGPLK
ncbi:putative casparian strip membrane protein [Rosa chinensis]|uniref:CASP-like protein n=1 Tax=Rosa chinensis TaxID=74649 RepID=A0A2P6QY45_ROSCH|nr:CASP-like protein 1E1 [Rosa chinensis]PRQ39091.1 putative casparian strip membrane protein [Rosa chinensis]